MPGFAILEKIRNMKQNHNEAGYGLVGIKTEGKERTRHLFSNMQIFLDNALCLL